MDRQNASAVDFTAPPQRSSIHTTMTTRGDNLSGFVTSFKAPLNQARIEILAEDNSTVACVDRPRLLIDLPLQAKHLVQAAHEFNHIADRLLGIAEELDDLEFDQAEANALTLSEVA